MHVNLILNKYLLFAFSMLELIVKEDIS